MANLQQLKLDITAITKDLKRNSTLGSRIKTLEERDYSLSEANSATLPSNVETEKKKQKDKYTNVIIHGFKKLSTHEAEENVKHILSFKRNRSSEGQFHRNNERAEQADHIRKITKPKKVGTHQVS